MAKHNEYARQALVAQRRDRPWAKTRVDLEDSAATHMRGAENHLKAALSSSNCRAVPVMLAVAAERIGRAKEAAATAGGAASGRKSRQLTAAIRKVENKVHMAMSGYASGPCVVSDLAGLGRTRRAAAKKRRK